LKIQCLILFPSTPRSFKKSLSSKCHRKNHICVSVLRTSFSSFLIWSPNQKQMRIVNNEARHYAAFSSLLLPPPS
jgi:hypothetical protein